MKAEMLPSEKVITYFIEASHFWESITMFTDSIHHLSTEEEVTPKMERESVLELERLKMGKKCIC